MRALAEFIMRGRMQAAVVALLGTAVPVLTPATIALVSLRKGPLNGLWILLWGLLPMLVYAALGRVQPLMLIWAISGPLVVYASALILRNSISWAYALMGMVAMGSLAALLLLLIVPAPLAELTKAIAEIMQQVHVRSGITTEFVAPGLVFAVGMIAYLTAISSLLGLLVGRWWQALLYNPGGFAAEFQHFRLGMLQASICLGAVVYCLLQSADYRTWGALFALPLVVMGVAIVHRFIAVKKMGTQWLVVFYLVLLVVNLVSQLLIILAFLDTWLNFRGRFKPKQ